MSFFLPLLALVILITEAQAQLSPSQGSLAPAPREILVTADAWAWSPPDSARISVQLEHTAPTAAAVAQVLDKSAKELIDRVRGDLGESVEINIQDISFTTAGTKDQKLSAAGHKRGTRVIGIQTDQLHRVSTAIDSALKTPGALVLDIQYSVRNGKKRRLAAVSEATARAREKAKGVAQTLGLQLGDVIEVTVLEEPAEKVERMERQRGDISALFHDEDAHVVVTVRYQILPAG